MEVVTYSGYTGSKQVLCLEDAVIRKIRSDPYDNVSDEGLERVNKLVPVLTQMLSLMVEKGLITEEEVCERVLGYNFQPYKEGR